MTAAESTPAFDSLGIVLIAHGSRKAGANADLLALAERLRERGLKRVFPCYLELAEPDIPTAGEDCIAAGASTVVFAPYFLSAGRHVADDLVRFRDELAHRHPGVIVRVAAPLGPHMLLDQIVWERVQEAL
jgi:sirohydrochlorin ferrochelatase